MKRTIRRSFLALALTAFLAACQSDPSPQSSGADASSSGGSSSSSSSSATTFLGGRWIDGAGDFFVADSGNNAIREVSSSSGKITTVAGITDPRRHVPWRNPMGIARDSSNNLYVADYQDAVIRKFDASTGTVTIVAGGGISGYGDGGPATSAELSEAASVAVDSLGNLYISDTYDDTIREVNAVSGIITTVAGTYVAGGGRGGYSGDGGPATSAQLFWPQGIALDNSNNLYIADTENYVIRRVDAGTGIITTVAGTYACCTWFFPSGGYSGDGGPATSAQLDYPTNITLDGSGNLYIADTINRIIREVNAGTGIITTVAGIPGSVGYSGDGGAATSAQLYGPESLTLDSSGNLYIADVNNNNIREVNASTGIITTVVGGASGGYSGDGGPATSAQLNGPEGIVFDSVGNLDIVDSGNNALREVDASTGLISTVLDDDSSGYSGDGGAATSALLDSPHGVAVDSAGNVYVADYVNNVIRKVDSSGNISTIAGNYALGAGYSGNYGAATSAQLNEPAGIALDGSNNLYFAESNNNVIRKVDSSTGIITTVAGNGNSGYSGDGEDASYAELSGPADIALDGANNLYIADQGNNVIRKVDAFTGAVTTVAGHGLSGYGGDDGLATDAALNGPGSVAVDSAGDIYIADAGNEVIRKVDASTGVITTVAGIGRLSGYSGDGAAAASAKLNSPSSIALDGAGNLYIADSGNDVIRKVSALTGFITTVAGTPQSSGFAGDSGAAIGALLSDPF